jgi:hypothetical protein
MRGANGRKPARGQFMRDGAADETGGAQHEARLDAAGRCVGTFEGFH